jgi:hypothetical protein
MKNLRIFAIVLFVMGLILASCEGPEGPRGNTGPVGPAGPNGNANVRVYGFPGHTFTTTSTIYDFYLPITKELMDSSLILPYFLDVNWYMAGSLGLSGAYATRYWFRSSDRYVSLNILDSDGSDYSGPSLTWDSVRVFVIPANQFYAAEPVVNFSNYYEVENYFSQK